MFEWKSFAIYQMFMLYIFRLQAKMKHYCGYCVDFNTYLLSILKGFLVTVELNRVRWMLIVILGIMVDILSDDANESLNPISE